MGLFGKKKATTSSGYTGPPHMDRNKADLIEGRRMCSGCFWYFVPNGGETVCSAECAEKARR